MGLAILSNGTFPSDCPSFGEIVAVDALQHAARISSANNNIDLSDNEYAHTNVGDVTYTSEGVSNGTGDAYIQTALDNKADNSFTMYVTAKLDLNAQPSYTSWFSGNFVNLSTGGLGIFLRSESDPDNAGKLRVLARGSITRKKLSDGTFGQSFADLVIVNNLDTLPPTLGWLVLSMEFDDATRVFRMRNLITEAAAPILAAEWDAWDYDGAERNADPASVPNHRLMFAGSTLDNENTMTLAECFYWSRALTSTELAEQLTYTRAFMQNARGVTLP